MMIGEKKKNEEIKMPFGNIFGRISN